MNPNEIFEETESLPEGLQFLTYEDVARILRVQRATIRSWVYRGLIRTNIKMGKKSLIPISELRRFVADKTRIREKKVFPINPPKVVMPQQESPSAETPQED